MMNNYGLYTRGGGGVITERNADYATIRLRVPGGGVLSAAQVKQLAKISEKIWRWHTPPHHAPDSGDPAREP